MTVLAASSAIAILTTIGIVFSVIFESLRFFALVPVSEFLFGLTGTSSRVPNAPGPARWDWQPTARSRCLSVHS